MFHVNSGLESASLVQINMHCAHAFTLYLQCRFLLDSAQRNLLASILSTMSLPRAVLHKAIGMVMTRHNGEIRYQHCRAMDKVQQNYTLTHLIELKVNITSLQPKSS